MTTPAADANGLPYHSIIWNSEVSSEDGSFSISFDYSCDRDVVAVIASEEDILRRSTDTYVDMRFSDNLARGDAFTCKISIFDTPASDENSKPEVNNVKILEYDEAQIHNSGQSVLRVAADVSSKIKNAIENDSLPRPGPKARVGAYRLSREMGGKRQAMERAGVDIARTTVLKFQLESLMNQLFDDLRGGRDAYKPNS